MEGAVPDSSSATASDDGWQFDAGSGSFPLEDASLSEALALVDATGLATLEDLLLEPPAETTPPSPLDSGSSTSTSSSVAETEQKKPKPSGTRQKEELAYLRSTVAQLETELAALKKQGTRSTEELQETATDPLVSAWEDIATRQHEQRQRAEVENTKLRRLVEEQLRVAKSFERLLKKRSVAELVGSSLSSVHRRPRMEAPAPAPAQKHSTSTSEFQELSETVDTMYSELSRVFADAHFACTALPMRDIQARVDDSLDTVVEAFDARIAPFDMHELANVTWQHMAVHTHPDRQTIHLDRVEMADDQFTREVITTLDTPRLKATFRGKILARRYVETDANDRVVILWASFMKPNDAANKTHEGAMRQQGYAILSRAPWHLGCGVGDAAATLTQTYLVFEPYDRDQSDDGGDDGTITRPTARRKVGALTNFVLNSVSLHMEEGRQMIENLMLEK